MTRVVGIDPGSLSIDVCGLLDGQLYLDRSWPTEDALADPEGFVDFLAGPGVPDLIAGPSGYGLPVQPFREATEADLRLAFLAPPGESGGIGGLRRLARQLGSSPLPVVYTPGVIHLETVPPHRKLNRVDLGTADKVCAAVLAIHEQCLREQCPPEKVSLILLELGGAFTGAVAVEQGQVTDGIGGTSGPIGWRSAGALDGEVAYLAGEVPKSALFQGGVRTFIERQPHRSAVGIEAYFEGAMKSVRQLRYAAPSAREVVLSGRHAYQEGLLERLTKELSDIGPVRRLEGFARTAKQGAQGAALMADGLAGGRHKDLVDRLGIREARGTVLDHLVFISPDSARRRLGITPHE